MGMAELTPGGKLLLGYMLIQHIVDGKEWVTVSELVSSLGLSERRVRDLLRELMARGLVEGYRNVERGKRYLYRLRFSRLNIERPNVEPAIYLLDMRRDISIPWDLTLRVYGILRSTTLLVYTTTMEAVHRLFELTRCTCLMLKLTDANAHEVAAMVLSMVRKGGIATAVYDSDVDATLINAWLSLLGGAGRTVRISNRFR